MKIHSAPHVRRYIELPDVAETEQQNLLDIITELEGRFPGMTG
jgi:hypothetical protein